MADDQRVLAGLRRALLAVLGVGLAGTAADLVLLAHYEDVLQWAPLVIISVCLLSVVWHAVSPGAVSLRLMRVTMTSALAGAATGVVLHYRGSMEFQLETDPSIGGVGLLMKVLTSKAPPTLAPMSLALLGLIGLASTYKEGT